MNLFKRNESESFSNLTDSELQSELEKAESVLADIKERRKMARACQIRFLQFALEAERRIHLIQYHGRTDETLDEITESRNKFWESYESSVLNYED